MSAAPDSDVPADEAAFVARVTRGCKIEADEPMPAAYRKLLQRQIAQHAHSEYVGMLPEGGWLGSAPSLARKAILLAKVQDEAGHAHYLYSALETLGLSRDAAYAALLEGRGRYLNIFDYPAASWADVGMIGWLTDGAAIVNQVPLSRCSYGPYARAMARICAEESFHHRQGFDLVRSLTEGTAAQRRMAQEAFDRWWWPTLMVFGPPDADSVHSDAAMRYGIKLYSNDTLRQKFIDQTVPQALYLGLTIPDPDLRFNCDTGHYEIGAIDWDEFRRVLAGGGVCRAERLAAKRRAWEQGAWVREAAAAAALHPA